ncbi:Retinoblastoma-binding protein [Coemansia interrupta]|uniref:Retinoblastoma-binding protein n=1 Tax=Coemansia interrupta TaxID=1126814 RepID=A0A9W8HF66_9FUNG|nr:Retinoblastoma-binding protein [Coemansia interrupta]
MSQVQYKFRSAKDYSSITFDGLSISVGDLKQEIMREQKLEPEEFDLVITNEQTGEDYKDTMALIPKNTMILVRRIPYTGPKMSRMVAVGNLQQQQQQQQPSGYGVGGGGGYNQRGYNANPNRPGGQFGYRGPPGSGLRDSGDGDALDQNGKNVFGVKTDINNADEAQIAAMLQQNSDQWEHQQSLLEMQRPVYQARPGFRPRPYMARPEHQGPPPPSYVCYRCGQQGHWIYSCPTIGQPNDGTGRGGGHRVKRTNGIPKSFLQKIDNLDDVGNALVTSDGTLVVATANEAAWNSAQRLTRNTISNDEEIESSLIPDDLKCNICHKLARDAVNTPCCKTVFCSTCIENKLLEPGDMHFVCPACNTKDIVPDQLEVADDVRGKVDEFLREYSAKQAASANSTSNTNTGASGNVNGVVAKPEDGSNGTQMDANPESNAPAVSAIGSAVRPPVPAQTQMQPRPRNFNMAMMPPPGMMMGMGMGMNMGMMPGYMHPGMMMRPPPGMVPPTQNQQWNGSAVGVTPTTNGQHDSRSDSRNRSRSYSRRSNRDRSRSQSLRRTPRSSREDSDMVDMNPGRDPADTKDDRHPVSARSNRSGRASSRGDSKARDHHRDQDRDRRRDSRSRSGRDHDRSGRSTRDDSRHRSRDYSRDRDRRDRRDRSSERRRDERHRDENRRDDSRSRSHRDERRRDDSHSRSHRDSHDDDRQRDRRDRGRDRNGSDKRSRSPAPASRSSRRKGSHDGDGNGDNENSAKDMGISIRGHSAVSKSDSAKPRSVLDRIRDDRSAAQKDGADSADANGGSNGRSGRRRRNRRR